MPHAAAFTTPHTTTPAPARVGLRTAFSALLGAALVAGLGACASLPPPLAKPISTGLTAPAAAPLAQVARASLPALADGRSGFRLLPDGDQAWDARLALIEQAQVSLDLQTYSLVADGSGQALVAALRQAAARGVRVRLLVDDLHVVGSEPLLASLAATGPVEVRLFNPLPSRATGWGRRLLASLHELERINRRMHNKLLVADGVAAITGGRNIGDEYFHNGAQHHFVDLDVWAMGPIVEDLAGVFDRFWNSDEVRLFSELQGTTDKTHTNAADAPVPAAAGALAAPTPLAPPLRPEATLDSLQQPALSAALASGRIALHWAPARLLADEPQARRPSHPETGEPPPGAMLRAVEALAQGREDLLIVSPYFIPGEQGLAHLQLAQQRGVRVQVLTNSASASDEPLAWWRYTAYRQRVAELGVQLYELSPALATERQQRRGGSSPLAASASSSSSASSTARLHSKWAVVDRRQVLIGSMNMDNRSARLNTELGLLIDSPALAQQLLEGSPGQVLHDAYRVQTAREADGRKGRAGLEWINTFESLGQAAQALRSDPEASLGRSLLLMLLSVLVPEAWL